MHGANVHDVIGCREARTDDEVGDLDRPSSFLASHLCLVLTVHSMATHSRIQHC